MNIRKLLLAGITVFSIVLQASSCEKEKKEKEEDTPGTEFTFFQLNLWVGLQNVNNGLDILCNQLIALKPDVASFCEFPSTGDENTVGSGSEYILKQAIDRIYKETGIRYYKTTLSGSGTRGVLTRHEIVEGAKAVTSSKGGNQPWFYRTVIKFNDTEIAVYSSHSDYVYYACYLPRGYGDGSAPYDWSKLKDGPITDVKYITERDDLGDRVQMAIDLKADCDKQAKLGRLCFYGGDLNQPSHLDWTKATGDLFQHNGVVMPWSVSKYLLSKGFSDAYRVVYPDPVANPGITWPVYNKDANSATAWAPEADERDRIDFIYYLKDERIKVSKAQLVGPAETMKFGEKCVESFVNKDEELILPANNLWCSDHRGLFFTFEIK